VPRASRAIRPSGGPLKATIRLPGSKSFTHRALVCAALAEGETVLRGALSAEDTRLTAAALTALGARVGLGPDEARVTGTAGRLARPSAPLQCGNSGTSIRLLTAVAALCRDGGEIILEGDEAMRRRPIGELVRALGELGVAARSQEGFPPVRVAAQGIPGGRCGVDGSQSSQFVSAILLASPYAASDVSVEVRGTLVSRPYVEMTLQTMADFGVAARSEGRKFHIAAGQRYRSGDYMIEADATNASYFLAAAAATGGRVRAVGLREGSLQGDAAFLEALEQMGCPVRRGSDWAEVEGGELHALDIDMGKMPDVVPTLAVLAALARGRSRLRNIRHLRLKECDRLSALATELKRCGVRVEEQPAELIIEGGGPHGAEIETYRDHRMAMSFAVLGLAVPGVVIKDPGCVAKSFPDFWDRFAGLYDD
jgi:3-phosphoshikimate 1-carboxyvinyltransferase